MSKRPVGQQFCCPICSRVGDPSKMVKDDRWDNQVHTSCVEKLGRWPSRARDPNGPSGTWELAA